MKRIAPNSGVLLICALLVCSTACAQSAAAPAADSAIPRFAIPDSGLVWSQLAHPLQFFDATGHRAAVFGRQSGQFEAWIYPMKLLHGFHLDFQQDGMLEPVHGESYLRQVVTRPESTTLVYVHPHFTVRQIIWTPLDKPAIVQFFDVETDKPLTITAKFTLDFKPMWPASLGGQYSYWMDEDRAFGLTDATGMPTAMIGSPVVGAFTEHMDHALINGEMLLQMRVTPEQARSQLLPLAMSLDMYSADGARFAYRRVLAGARKLYEERVSHARDLLARTMTLETPDADLNRAFAWAKVALDAGWVCHWKYGCGLVAGYGPADDSERPGFAWWFGGDAMMTSWAMEDYGDTAGALQALRFLKSRQRDDGKMMHEMTQSVDLVDWFGKYGFAYYHADTTPMYLYSLAQYWQRTGDRKFLDEFFESARKAYAYCISTLDPADGLMDNTKAGLAAVEVGVLRGKVVKDVYLEGFWLAALDSVHELARAVDDPELEQDALTRLGKAHDSLANQWWNPQEKYFAFGLAADGRRADMIGNWPSVALALAPGIADEQAEGEIASLASPEIATDWGARWLSDKSPFYDPVSYNNGTAWPFMNTFVSWAEYRHGNALAGFSAWSDTARLTGIQSPGYMPEHMNGGRFLPGERSVPHQLFSSVGVVVPAVRGLLGLYTRQVAEILSNNISVLSFRPRPPADWPFLRFSNYAVGNGHLSGEILQEPRRTTIHLDYDGEHSTALDLSAPIPLLAHATRVLLNGKAVKFELKPDGDTAEVLIGTSMERTLAIEIDYTGGVGIAPPVVSPSPGDQTSALKILRAAARDESTVELTVAGLGGRSYRLDLLTSLPKLAVNGARVEKTSSGFRVVLGFDGSGYATRTLVLTF